MHKKLHYAAQLLLPALISLACTLHGAAASPLPFQVPGMVDALGLAPDQLATDYSIQETASSSPANIFWPREKPSLTLQVSNNGNAVLQTTGTIDVIAYGTHTDPSDAFNVSAYRVGVLASVPISLNVLAKGWSNITVEIPVPERFGGYALVANIPGHGRDFVATLIRCLPAQPGSVQFPAYALDAGYVFDASPEDLEQMADYLQRLGVKGTRSEIGFYLPSDPRDKPFIDHVTAALKTLQAHDITVMLTSESGQGTAQPLPVSPRGYLDASDTMIRTYPGDNAWMPSADDEYQQFIKDLAGSEGWPKGPINAVELWNEPWEGVSISGWGADTPRYREMYTHMAQGIEQARTEDGVQVLIGGACSSMNTDDKLFSDGSDTFLKWLDFTSIHYQPLGETPVLYPKWMQRESPYGPVRVWDTETWAANSEDRVSATIASSRAQGLDRVSAVNQSQARAFQEFTARDSTDHKSHLLVYPLPVSAAIAACQNFLGQRKFDRILFKNGLPWIFVFDGLKGADDGTAVVVGDLGGIFNPNSVMFHTVRGLSTATAESRIAALQTQMAALPADAPATQSLDLRTQIKSLQLLHDASMTVDDMRGAVGLYDYFGNKVASQHGKIVVPLNQFGYFVRPSGARGSFDKMIQALESSRIDGYEPVELVPGDLTAAIESHPTLNIRITNILNRAVTGLLTVKVGDLTLSPASETLTLAANETRSVAMQVTGGSSLPENTYVFDATFDAGPDGVSEHAEPLHVNVIARRTITVDGNLDDWKGVIAVPMRSGTDASDNSTIKAWLPFETFDRQTGVGSANIWLACDDRNFYFAARILDNSPSDGGIRYAARNDDSYFYPDIVHVDTKDKDGKVIKTDTYTWPVGVRHYTYRRDPDLPADSPDNVQIAFNVLPEDQKGWLSNPPGLMPHFMVYKSTDYEYALNKVAPANGGGTEVWRLLAPGVPYKHFYPREPKAPVDGGPVTGAQLVIKSDGNFRIVEASIPWTEIPDVKKRIDAGQTIKFNCRVNDDKGPSYELAANRGESKQTIYALHDLWASSWANEVQFGVQP